MRKPLVLLLLVGLPLSLVLGTACVVRFHDPKGGGVSRQPVYGYSGHGHGHGHKHKHKHKHGHGHGHGHGR